MDEIIIEEKKYISSKRAAKMTGYAKDYIGQLCREGRVPARLVGRSWYVLETAIQDHRFGNKEVINAEDMHFEHEHKEDTSSVMFRSPSRYESSPVEELPSINRLQDDTISSDKTENNDFSQRLQDSWSAWFDHIQDIKEPQEAIIEDATPVLLEELEHSEKEEEIAPENKNISVPIHIQRPIPKELLPSARPRTQYFLQEEVQKTKETGSKAILMTQIAGALFSVVFAALAMIGSGYIDKYITSLSQVSIISGVVMYNK